MKSTHLTIWATALGLLATTLAHGYRIDDDGSGHNLHWRSMPVHYKLVVGNAPSGNSGEAAVRSAFQTWDDASANVSFAYDGYAAVGSHQYDGVNMVYWVNSNWSYDHSLLAITMRYFDRNDGHILDADMLFNGQDYGWSVGTWNYDIQNTATHEAGHLIGMGHSTDARATMFASAASGETSKRTLNSDDAAGLNAVYGGVDNAPSATENPPPSGTNVQQASGVGSGGGGGGCSIGVSGERRDPMGLFFVALVLAGLALRSRVRQPIRMKSLR
jgi:hypothetical protein